MKFAGTSMFTESGKPLRILFPGWYNRGWGPDFQDARIEIDDTQYFGDIEIHIEEGAWNRHSHQTDEAYNRVVLHVFLISSGKSAKNQLNQVIPSLHLQSENFKEFWSGQLPLNENVIKELPGACGLSLADKNAHKLKTIIRQAAEDRLIRKSGSFEKILAEADHKDAENILFTSICRSLGYSSNSACFVAMSQRYPYSRLRPFFESLHRQSRKEILGRWLGYLGYLDSIEINLINHELRREWLGFIQTWNDLNEKLCYEPKASKSASRPLNNPVRRLIGLYYHLETSWFQGLIKTWLLFFDRCRKVIDDKRVKQIILKELDTLFPQPAWDPMNKIISPVHTLSKISETKLIGKNRQLIILVNSVFPFFLAWSKIHGDRFLGKTLFSLFLILPNEGRNSKTLFMENRLFKSFNDFKWEKNLGYHQGLIQLYDDCCTSFYEGCQNCSLLKLLRQRE